MNMNIHEDGGACINKKKDFGEEITCMMVMEQEWCKIWKRVTELQECSVC